MAGPMGQGFSLGCGDAVLGLNPVDDGVESVATVLKQFDEFRDKWEIPTQICVLAHVTTQIEAAKNIMDFLARTISSKTKMIILAVDRKSVV